MGDSNNDSGLDKTIPTKISCERTAGLQAKLRSVLEETLDSVTNEMFVTAYKTCYQGFEKKDELPRASLSGSSKEAKAYREQFNKIVKANIFDAIDETVSNMDDKLTELENLIKTQSDSTFVWRPPGDAYKHMIPFDNVARLEEKKCLEDKVEKEAEVINLLQARLLQKRNKAIALHEKLLSKINEISEVASRKTVESSES